MGSECFGRARQPLLPDALDDLCKVGSRDGEDVTREQRRHAGPQAAQHIPPVHVLPSLEMPIVAVEEIAQTSIVSYSLLGALSERVRTGGDPTLRHLRERSSCRHFGYGSERRQLHFLRVGAAPLAGGTIGQNPAFAGRADAQSEAGHIPVPDHHV